MKSPTNLRLLLFIAGLEFYASILCAQPVFQRAIGAEGYEKGSVIRQLSDGGFIIGGETDRSFGLQESDMLMVRTDQIGNVVWTQTYGGAEREVVNDVLQAADLGFVALAEKYQPNKKEGEFMTVLKTDVSGNLQWKKMFDEDGNETEGFSMAATPDGNYIIAGIIKKMNVASGAFFSVGGETQRLFLLKIDGNGNKVWSRKLSVSGYATTGVSVIVARDGSYVVTGNIARRASDQSEMAGRIENVSENEERNMLLAKIRPDGSLAWAKEYAANRITAGFSLVEKSEGGFMVVGIATIGSTSNIDIFAMSLSNEGNIQWAKTIGTPAFETVSDVLQTSDGGFVISGTTESEGPAYDDALLIKLSHRGILLWAKTIGGKSLEYGSKMALSEDGIFLTGEVSSPPSESFDVMLLKMDLEGNSGCFSRNIQLSPVDFQIVMKAVEGAATTEVEKGNTPPDFRKTDINNINGQSRLVRMKNLCN